MLKESSLYKVNVDVCDYEMCIECVDSKRALRSVGRQTPSVDMNELTQ